MRPSTSSDAVTVNVIVLPSELEVEPVGLDGTFTVGGVVSSASSKLTVTVNVPVPVFPTASVAVHVTVVAPIGNNEPEEWEQVTGMVVSGIQ